MDQNLHNLRTQVREAFPPAERPADDALTVHGPRCTQCSYLIDDLKNEREPLISREGTLLLFGELSLLSPSGFLWALPSYLEVVLDEEGDAYNFGEFLAYPFMALGNPDEITHLKARVKILTEAQVDCLISILRYLKEEFGEIYHQDFDPAIASLLSRGETLPNENP